MSEKTSRGYKRSWKNLLINKRYQLRFTLFMVALAAVLMGALGYWVMRVASKATQVGVTLVMGEPCAEVPPVGEGESMPVDEDTPTPIEPEPEVAPAAGSAAAAGSGDGSAVAAGSGNGSAAAAGSGSGDGSAAAGDGSGAGSAAVAGSDDGSGEDGERRHAVVNIDESSLTMTAVAPADFAAKAVSKWECMLRQAATIERLERGRGHIFLVLLGTGILLVVGLAVYGIKMTHKVAGPLYKVSLYLAKMRDGRYDTVYNLRKGDQLVDFYEHFKTAHAGVVEMQKADIERLRAVLAAAEAAGVAGASPELDRQLEAARALLAQKEQSLA